MTTNKASKHSEELTSSIHSTTKFSAMSDQNIRVIKEYLEQLI